MMPDVTAAELAEWLVALDRRLAALERAKASQPAPEQPPTPAAGVESGNALFRQITGSCLEVGSWFDYATCEKLIADHDADLTKAARDGAIGECIQILYDHGWTKASPIIDIFRTIANKEQPQ